MRIILTLSIVLSFALSSSAQKADTTSCLFHVGLANTLLGGMYDGFYPVSWLKKQGDFGIGAPDKLDGELLIDRGIVWQTTHTGHTFEADEDLLLPYAAVHFFTLDSTVSLNGSHNRDALFAALDTLLDQPNGMYGVRVTAKFKNITTRAFPAVTDQPSPALASIMDRQVLLQNADVEGVLVGYKLPPYMAGMNFPGYHFHFLSSDMTKGGHMIDFTATDIRIEVDRVHSFKVQLPETKDFDAFDFGADRSSEARTIQRGGKQ